MAVIIRLARHGRRNSPYYRIVVADKTKKRDGRYLEHIGHYDTRVSPAKYDIKEDRVQYWVGVGAEPTDTVSRIIDKKLPGFLDEMYSKRLEKVRNARKGRKTRAKAAGKTKTAKPVKEKKAKPKAPKKKAETAPAA